MPTWGWGPAERPRGCGAQGPEEEEDDEEEEEEEGAGLQASLPKGPGNVRLGEAGALMVDGVVASPGLAN